MVDNFVFRDSQVISIYQNSWFEINEDIKVKDDIVLNNLFITYAKSWRIPKLISKFLTALDETVSNKSGGILFQKGYVRETVLKTFSQCIQDTPFGQILEIWELFLVAIDKFCTSAQHEGPIFLIGQFFSSFLLHAHLFNETVLPVVEEKITTIIEKTHQSLLKMSSLFSISSNNDNLLKASWLLMVHAYSEFKLVFHAHKKKSISRDMIDSSFCIKKTPSNISLQDLCFEFLKNDEKYLSYLAFKMLINQIKVGLIEQESNVEHLCLKYIIHHILEETKLSAENCLTSSWNFNISSLNQTNYGIAFWHLFLKHIHLFIKYISDKDLVTLCSTIVKILIMQNRSYSVSEATLQFSIFHFVKSNFFIESHSFQTAFITAIWKYCASLTCPRKRKYPEFDHEETNFIYILEKLHHSRQMWRKFSHTTPKDTENCEINSLWNTIKTSADILNSLLEKSLTIEGKFKDPEIKNLIEILNFLPLEYLLPSNQMRCIIGLSTILFVQTAYIPLPSANESVCTILKYILHIFEGVRSVWFFDFVHPIPFIKAILNGIAKLEESQSTLDSNIYKQLLEKIIHLSTRNVQCLHAFENYMPELMTQVETSRLFAFTFLCFFQKLIELLGRSYLLPQIKEVSEKLAEMSCSSIVKCMRHWKRNDKNNLDICCLLITCYDGLIQLVLKPKCQFQCEKQQKWLKHVDFALEVIFENDFSGLLDEENCASFFNFICTISTHKLKISPYISDDFSIKAWKFVRHYIFQRTNILKETFLLENNNEKDNDIQNYCYFCSKSYCYINSSGEQSSLYLIMKQVFTESVKKCFVDIVNASSESEFRAIFRELSDDVEHMNVDITILNPLKFNILLDVISSIFVTSVEEIKIFELSCVIQKCLRKLNLIITQTCSSASCLLNIVVPSLNFISSILKIEKNILPQHFITQCFYTCLAVKTSCSINQSKIFIKVHHAFWSVLHELLIHHPFNVIAAIPAFIPCLTYLVKLVIYASNQDFMLSCDDKIRRQILLCVQNVDRIIGLVTKYKVEFAKVVPYLIANYMDFMQNITIYPAAKVIIISSITKLLEICSEDSLKMLSVNISHNCREIYNTTLKSYKHLRYSGQT